MNRQTQQGFGLLEVVVYAALIVIIGVAVTTFLLGLVRVNDRAQATSQALSDARSAMAALTREARHAESLYDPTSEFDTHPGQLSLETARFAPAGETTTYVDFYVDDERLYMKREGEAAQLVTSERVKVTNFVVRHVDTSVIPETIRLELTVTPPGTSLNSAVTLYATTSLRSYAQ